MIKCYWNDKEIEFKPFKYPAGEVAYKIEGAPSKIICWFESSDDLLLVLILNEHFPSAELVFPYLPFGREDRRVADNASFGLKGFLDCIFINTSITTFDIHSFKTIELSRSIKNLDAEDIIFKVIEEIKPNTIAFPDEGATYRYSIQKPEEVIFAKKKRDLQTGEILEYKLNQEPKGNKILVIDDICDGGRTFIELAKLLPDKELYLYVSHGIFSKGFEELKKYYKHIYTTDSYKGARDNEFVTEYRCL